MRNIDNLLLIGCRKRDNIEVYDLRMLKEPIVKFARSIDQSYTYYANQRYYFDVDQASETLIAGNPQGQIIGYNLARNECKFFFAAHFEGIPALAVNRNSQQ